MRHDPETLNRFIRQGVLSGLDAARLYPVAVARLNYSATDRTFRRLVESVKASMGWGQASAADLLDRITIQAQTDQGGRTGLERAVIASDVHIPFQDQRAVDLWFRFLEWFQPDRVFLDGDILDCWDISKFVKPVDLGFRIGDEIDKGRAFLGRLRRTCPAAEIVYIFGNHEFRFDVYVASQARELSGLRGLSLEEQLDLDGLGIKAVNNHLREQSHLYGKLLIGHFNRASKHSAYTEKLLIEDKGISLVQAHTHRLGTHYRRVYDGVIAGWGCGCLCDLEPRYIDRPNWQQGFLTVHKDPESDFFSVTVCEIIDNQVIYGDQIFRG